MERPIILKAHEVRGILDGRQTQLRRIIKPPHWSLPEDLYVFESAGSGGQKTVTVPDDDGADYFVECPFGQVGDRLWGRETTWVEKDTGAFAWYIHQDAFTVDPVKDDVRKKPAGQMPRASARILLEIVSVRVERLQDISEVDAHAEGMMSAFDPRGEFACRQPEWDANPFVWCIEVRRVSQ